jgi:predicted glycosyltransferase
MRPPLLFYCQHSVGLGHLIRSYALCAALAERFRVVLVCGGALPRGIEPPRGVEVVALPPLGVNGNGGFVSHDPRFTLERAWEARAELLLQTLRSVRPRVVLVELFPFGRAKFARELVPLLEAARRAGALTACSLRDILVTARPNQRAHDDRACAIANAHLDAVLVHSDPRFARLEDTFAPAGPLQVPVRYTGFVVSGAARSAPRRRAGHVVVSAGGGLVGEPLLLSAIEAQRICGIDMRVIAGPMLPEDAWRRLLAAAAGRPGVELVRSVLDLGAELRAAAGSVSQCGYNTALEIVRARVPALVVPYATPEEDEQRRRARRLARLGALRVLDPERLDPPTLARELEQLPTFRPAPTAIDLRGAQRAGRLLAELAGVGAPAPAASNGHSAADHPTASKGRPARPAILVTRTSQA